MSHRFSFFLMSTSCFKILDICLGLGTTEYTCRKLHSKNSFVIQQTFVTICVQDPVLNVKGDIKMQSRFWPVKLVS